MTKERWVSVYIMAGFVFVLASVTSDTWLSRIAYAVIGMGTLLAGVLHSHAIAEQQQEPDE